MQFQVPQFLDVEDKVIGPFTIKQFLYLAGGAGSGYLIWRFTPVPYLGVLLGGCLLAFGASLAFYKYNSHPFIYTLEAAMNYIRSTHLYVWKRREKEAEKILDLNNFKPVKRASGLLGGRTESKLNDLTWGIDVTREGEVEAQKVHSDNAA